MIQGGRDRTQGPRLTRRGELHSQAPLAFCKQGEEQMFLRFLIRQTIYLIGRNRDELDISVNFNHASYAVKLTMPGEEVFEIPKAADFGRFCRIAIGLQFELTDEGKATPPLSELAKVENHSDLLRLMREVAIKVFRAIRNFGIIPEMPETLPEGSTQRGDFKSELRKWNPEISSDGKSWVEICPFQKLGEALIFYKLYGQEEFEKAELNVFLWPEIVEALEDNKNPTPENEFLTNAIGHLRMQNFRLAVIDSIIGLEIVLTQFLSNYLGISKGIPKKRIENFLSPEMGITARLSASLNLTLHESYLKKIDFDKVLKVVQWRNAIVHKTGGLPSIPEDNLRENISAVLKLIGLLAERRDDEAARIEKEKIAEALKTKEPLFITIWVKPAHRVLIEIEYSWYPIPSDYREKIDTLITRAAQLLKERDRRFNPEKHLAIHFKNFGKSLGRFINGSFTLRERREAEK
jgi:hypothetical protein